MADGNQQLVIDLEARFNKFEKAFNKASGIANDNWRNVENRGRQAAQRLDGTFNGLAKPRHASIHVETSGLAAAQTALNSLRLPHDMLNFEHLKGGLGGIAAGLGLSEVSKLADEWTLATNRIAGADVEGHKVAVVMGEVADIAMRSRTGLEQVAQVFAGLNRAAHEFGGTQAEALVATEAVTKALTLSGSTTQEIQGALSDLTQGLQAGVLQGQELKALLREVPDFAIALAKELHVGVGELKEMGSTGALTAEKVFHALVNASDGINEKFARTSATVEQAFQNMQTAAARFIGQNSTIQTATSATTAIIQGAANHMGVLATGAGALAAVIATRLIAAGITPLTASLMANARQALITGAAHAEFASIVGGSSAAMLAGSVAARVFSTALAAVGGPVGAVIIGITAAATWYASEAQRAEVATRKYADAYDKVKVAAGGATEALKASGDAAGRVADRMNAIEINKLSQELQEAQRDAVSAVNAVAAALDTYRNQAWSAGEVSRGIFDKVPEGAEAAEKAMGDVEKALHGDAEAALRAQNEVNALANAHPDFQPLADALNPLLSKLIGTIATVRSLKAEIAGLNAGPAPKPDTHWTGTFDAGKARDQFAARAGQDAVDEAKKDDAWRLRKKAADLLKENPIMRPGEAFKTGAAVIAAEDDDSGSGHKGRAKHPRTAKPKKSEEEKESERHDKSIKDEIKSLEEESRIQDAEAAAQGKSNAQKRIATELAKLNADATTKEGQKISGLITKIEAQKDAQEKLKKQEEQTAAIASTFRDGFADALDQIILKGGKAQEVFANLLKSFESMALKGALTGEGAFGGILGGLFGSTSGASSATNTAGGGLLGLALKGMGAFADGGQITGSGGPRSDNILARVSPGEFVVNAKAAQGNLALLHAINGGKLPAFADGGVVGGGSAPRFSSSGRSGGPAVNVTVSPTLHANGTHEENQALVGQMGPVVKDAVGQAVADHLRQQMRPGGMLDGSNFTTR